jgi:hypothetical protein
MSTDEARVEGSWYWVTYDGETWFPAKADKQRVGGWSNDDTWEDFYCKITKWILIPTPDNLTEREGAGL